MSNFGFGDARKKKGTDQEKASPDRRKLALEGFKPKTGQPPVDEVTLAETDKVAEESGFPSREAKSIENSLENSSQEPSLRRKRKSKARAKGQLNIQGPKDTLEKFIDFCDTAELSYWEGIEQLLKKVKR